MINTRLRTTIQSNGYTEASVAKELGIDSKTVQRWVTQGRTPHRSTAFKVGKLLNVPDTWLWPSLDDKAKSEHPSEVVAFYPHRSEMPKRIWLEMILSARKRIDLFANASLFLPEDNPDSIELLRHKAANGVPVRIMMGDPKSEAVKLRAEEERLHEGLIGRVHMALSYYRPLLGAEGVTFHLHSTALYNSIFRYDDQMLINQHIYGTYGYIAPILHLQKVEGSDLFETYMRSFEMVWNQSYQYVP